MNIIRGYFFVGTLSAGFIMLLYDLLKSFNVTLRIDSSIFLTIILYSIFFTVNGFLIQVFIYIFNLWTEFEKELPKIK